MKKRTNWAVLLRRRGVHEAVVEKIQQIFDSEEIIDEQDLNNRFAEFVHQMDQVVKNKDDELNKQYNNHTREINELKSRRPKVIPTPIFFPM